MRRWFVAALAGVMALATLTVAPAHAQDGEDAVEGDLVGCGTDQPSFTVNLVGRRGGFWFNNAIYHPDSALAAALPVSSALEYTLGATLAAGDYEVSTISVDNHTEDPFRLLFGIVDRSPIESYGLAFDYGGAGQVVTPDLVPDLPDDDNWYADVPLDTPVPLSWSIGPDNPLFPQQDPFTPPEVTDRLPGYPLGTITLDSPQTSVWSAHVGELDPSVEPVDAGSIVPYFATFTCTDLDDCDDNYSDTNIIALDPLNPPPGTDATVTGDGFEPGVTVDITLESSTDPPASIPLGTSVIGALGDPDAGMLNATISIPADLDDGIWTVSVVSQKCADDMGSTDFVVGEAGAQLPTEVESGGTPTGDGPEIGTGVPNAQPASSSGVSPASGVRGATQSSGGSLATTGSNRTLSLAGFALGLLALGGVFVMTGSRRRSRRRSDTA